MQFLELFAAHIKGFVIAGQPGQLVKRQAHQRGRQPSAHRQTIERRGHGAQPQQQVLRFAAGKHRILIGQIDRSHGALGQRTAHGRRLFAGAHQHGNVGWAHALQRLALFGKTGTVIHQPLHDLAGAKLCAPAANIVIAQGRSGFVRALVPGNGQRRHGLAGLHQHLAAAIGLDGLKRQGILIPLSKHESALACTLFGLRKPLVDSVDQRMGGAKVGVQHIVPPGRRFAGLQIAVNVGAAKAVDGLLGVTNQQQCAFLAVVGRAINLVKQAILQR